jgi:hypothetical protein
MYFFLFSYLRCNDSKLVIFNQFLEQINIGKWKFNILNYLFKYKFLIQDSEVCFLKFF